MLPQMIAPALVDHVIANQFSTLSTIVYHELFVFHCFCCHQLVPPCDIFLYSFSTIGLLNPCYNELYFTKIM